LFTGIVEEIGIVRSIFSGRNSGEIEIEAKTVLEKTQIGDSIAVNGVCLTVTKLKSNSFTADVMPETLRRTNLGTLVSGSRVDLERAMPADGRFGGHIVSGHIDGTGTIVSMKHEENAVWVRIKASPEIIGLIIEKGSITIDGISLTVAGLGQEYFEVSIIPHTASETILLTKKAGDMVNLENDVVGKYVKRLLGIDGGPVKQESRVTLEFLKEHGF